MGKSCERNSSYSFVPIVLKPWISREHNSSYNFILIFLQLCTCFLHSLKMCICFSYNPCLIFCHFFLYFSTLSFSDLRSIDVLSGYLVIATFHTIVNRSFWNFAHIFSRVRRSARGLDMIFKFIFVTFSPLTLSITKTRLCKYVENFTSKKKLKNFRQKPLIFSYFCSKHRLWVLVRTASARWF